VLDRASLPAAELARGRQLVTRGDTALKVPACIACHGERLSGALPAIPGLVGLPRDYINAQFGAWRNGSRHALAPDCMGTIATRLSLADVSAISAWLASEPLPADPSPAQTLPRPCRWPAAAPRRCSHEAPPPDLALGALLLLAIAAVLLAWPRAEHSRARRKPGPQARTTSRAAPTWRAPATAPPATRPAAALPMPADARSTRPLAR
jgi:cytochrome c553